MLSGSKHRGKFDKFRPADDRQALTERERDDGKEDAGENVFTLTRTVYFTVMNTCI